MAQDRDDRASGYRPAAADVFARPDVFAKPGAAGEPVFELRRGLDDQLPFDPARIMASIGEVPYEWSIDNDALVWGRNAAEVLMYAVPLAAGIVLVAMAFRDWRMVNVEPQAA